VKPEIYFRFAEVNFRKPELKCLKPELKFLIPCAGKGFPATQVRVETAARARISE
jgi:hypothetical protein